MKHKIVIILIVLAATLLADQVVSVWAAKLVPSSEFPGYSLKFILRRAITCIPLIIALFLIHKPKEILPSLGLNKNILYGLGVAVICTLPLLIGFPIIGKFNPELSYDHAFRNIVLAAIYEEVVYRGFMFGQLFRYGKIGFLWAVLLPAVLFGLGHIYQGHDLASSLLAFGVTFVGALYFSWIYVEWNFNLWVPIGLHALMNMCWILFPVEGNETAIGAFVPNLLRISSILIAIGLTVMHRRKAGEKVFGYPIVNI